MSRIITIAWREFKQTVMRKVFLLAILGVPVLIIGAIALAAVMLVSHEEPPLIGTVVLAASSPDVAEALQEELTPENVQKDLERQIESQMQHARQPGGTPFATQGMNDMPAFKRGEIKIAVEPEDIKNPSAPLDEFKRRVIAGDLLAVVVVPDRVIEMYQSETSDSPRPDNRFELTIAPSMDADHVDLLERSIGQAVVRVRADRAGLQPEQTLALLNAPRSDTRKILDTGEETSESEGVRELRRMVPMVFMILLWMGVFIAGQHLLMSTIEEKSNRVMEVLLSAVSPMQLMTGKILGHGGVGLLITGIYSSLGLFALIYFAATHFIDPILFVYLGVYFFMAYFMIASLMAAVGGAVTDIREANTLMTPVMLIVMIPWFLWFPIIQDPNGVFATVLSFVPPMTPFVMILRTSADEAVPFWQIPATIAWGYLCVIAMMWMAAKIFRVGVLMYGKPPSFFQLLKWLRYS